MPKIQACIQRRHYWTVSRRDTTGRVKEQKCWYCQQVREVK